MDQLSKLCVCLTILLIFTGCAVLRPNTKPIILDGDAVPDMNVSSSVSLRNGAINTGEVVIGEYPGFKFYGDYYQFTETAIGTAKSILSGQNILVEKEADKTLELKVTKTVAEQLFFRPYRVTVEMEVKLGSGGNKNYTGIVSHWNNYVTTHSIEVAIAKCVKEMLKDDEVLNYLRK